MTFSDYFSSTDSAEVTLAHFGYAHRIKTLSLPSYIGDVSFVRNLHDDFLKIIPNVTVLSEISRREFLIAPVIAALVVHFGIKVRSEFTLKVSDELQGNIDYLLSGNQNIVVIEAKQGDLQRGFQQLAAEMVAVARWSPNQSARLYGAVTLGDAWRFALLDNETKTVTLDIRLLTVPEDLEELVRTLIAMLNEDAVLANR